MTPDLPLAGRSALVTGVSRRRGIGFAVACNLASMGASLVVAHHRAHDEDQPWGADDLSSVVREVRAARATSDQTVTDIGVDLASRDAPEGLVAAATVALGHIDILVCNHARSGGDGPLGTLTADMIDAHYAVNTRSSLLLTQAFAAQHDGGAGGRVIFMTSGQGLGPMPFELAYASSKGAIAAVTSSIATQLAGRGITVNCINPGPVDTGYMDPETRADVARGFPSGRMGRPEDVARLIGFLVSGDGEWITGQVINSEGGFVRSPAPS